MDKMINKSGAISNIVRKLESEESFRELMPDILKNTVEYFSASEAVIFQIDESADLMENVVFYSENNTQETIIKELKFSNCILCDNELINFNIKKCKTKDIEFFEKYNLKTVISMPIYINGKVQMYLCIFDIKKIFDIDDEQKNFLDDVCRIVQSIINRKVMSNSLVSSYEVLKDILSNIGSGITVFDKKDGTILFENDIVNKSQDYKRVGIENINFYFEKKKNQSKKNYTKEHYDAQSGLWYIVKFSDLLWVNGRQAVVCMTTDITQRKKTQQKIEYQANNDYLTGLYNRLKCESDLRKIINDASKNNEKGAVLFIDLDDFKHINDGLGHKYGDVLLQQVAAGIQSVAGFKGHCYRMGGDEFVVIVVPEMIHILNNMIKNVIVLFNKPWNIMEVEYYCTMSMGIAYYPEDSGNVNEVIKLADVAMYDAKKLGKNRYCIYDRNRDVNIKRFTIENALRQALANDINEFEVYYQPVVDVNSLKYVSCEALIRWNNDLLGFVSPGEFIPLAESVGLITTLGEYVMQKACLQCKKWNDQGQKNFHININLSVVQLLQKDIDKKIISILQKTGVNTSNIVLEITESFAIHDMDKVIRVLTNIKKIGVKIALDDFGTGYSSLNYIKRLPLDIIKVDKSFIDDIVEDVNSQAFVKMIVDLSKSISTEIVVEGVENEEQYNVLKDIGVDFIQGYYFGKPMPSDEFEKIFKGEKS